MPCAMVSCFKQLTKPVGGAPNPDLKGYRKLSRGSKTRRNK